MALPNTIHLSQKQLDAIIEMCKVGELADYGIQYVQVRGEKLASTTSLPDPDILLEARHLDRAVHGFFVERKVPAIQPIAKKYTPPPRNRIEQQEPAQDTADREYVDCYWGLGRRKTAVARVRIFPGLTFIKVNGRSLNEYFTSETHRKSFFGPLEACGSGTRFGVIANVSGGGSTGQAGALIMGLSRALSAYDDSLIPILRGGGFLTRDDRMKERKKYGRHGARKGFQFSKR
jgi:small subunit ribosomal protein S9